MKTSADGVSFICSEEGFVGRVYRDAAGIATIGFGHVLRPCDPITMNRDQAWLLMQHDLGPREDAVNRDVRVPLTQCQFDALVSFTYNAGVGALEQSTALKLLNAGDYTAAAEALKAWCHRRDPATGALVVDAGLAGRRAREVTMFLSDGNAA